MRAPSGSLLSPGYIGTAGVGRYCAALRVSVVFKVHGVSSCRHLRFCPMTPCCLQGTWDQLVLEGTFLPHSSLISPGYVGSAAVGRYVSAPRLPVVSRVHWVSWYWQVCCCPADPGCLKGTWGQLVLAGTVLPHVSLLPPGYMVLAGTVLPYGFKMSLGSWGQLVLAHMQLLHGSLISAGYKRLTDVGRHVSAPRFLVSRVHVVSWCCHICGCPMVS